MNNPLTPTSKTQSRMLLLAAIFIVIYAITLTLSPAARERTWDVDYRWSHWLGVAAWAIFILAGHIQTKRKLAWFDPYLFPLVALLTGWGLLSIWRLTANFGQRQMIWLLLSCAVMLVLLRFDSLLSALRRFKYLWLISGLTLTGLTLIFGVNPQQGGPNLWLGCCGVYLQPSEILKLLLIVYLAAFFADRPAIGKSFVALILPALLLTGLALVILIVQRDLGTASIFIFLYTVMVYLATGRSRVLWISAALMFGAGIVGYFAVEVIQVRIQAWLNPWADPSGTGYQIIQSLMAVANGGLIGRGPGLGYPNLVPVAISDFIFAAIAEETGLAGTFAILVLFALLSARSFTTAFRSSDTFHRLLAAGLGAYFGIQSIIIIGGNLRLLPLTGVTLPFMSYGGSSLLTSIIAITLLLKISHRSEDETIPLPQPAPYLGLAFFIGLGFLALAVTNVWWSIWRADALLARTDNMRRYIADLYVPRGDILDQTQDLINATTGISGQYNRVYNYPQLGATAGYINYAFGQSGLESSLDPYLRGLQGNPAWMVLWNRLLYGTPPPGLDVRITLNLETQQIADQWLADEKGAVIILNSNTGEILAMASHPTFDPNQVGELGEDLAADPNAPLLNRVTLGQYEAGKIISIFNEAAILENEALPQGADLIEIYNKLGFYSEPQIRMPVAPPSEYGEVDNLRLSPLQLSLAATVFNHGGVKSPGQIAIAVDTPEGGWVILPALSDSMDVFTNATVESITEKYKVENQPYWRTLETAGAESSRVSWFVGGTSSAWQGTPIIIVVALEGDRAFASDRIGQAILQEITTQ